MQETSFLLKELDLTKTKLTDFGNSGFANLVQEEKEKNNGSMW